MKGTAKSKSWGYEQAQALYPLGECIYCDDKATEHHHIDGDPCNNAKGNVLTVCRRCHMEIDGRLKEAVKRAHRINERKRAVALKECRICGKKVEPGKTRNGRCKTCDSYFRRNGKERPYGKADGRSSLGVNHSHAKLTPEKVRAIRASSKTGEMLAVEYGVSGHTISMIKLGRIWQYVE